MAEKKAARAADEAEAPAGFDGQATHGVAKVLPGAAAVHRFRASLSLQSVAEGRESGDLLKVPIVAAAQALNDGTRASGSLPAAGSTPRPDAGDAAALTVEGCESEERVSPSAGIHLQPAS